MAWDQQKGIAAVEVRVNGGPWHPARLAAVPGIDTWRQWVWESPASPGTHPIEARATDATGYAQTAAQVRQSRTARLATRPHKSPSAAPETGPGGAPIGRTASPAM